MATEGYMPAELPSVGKKSETWYRVYGNLTSRRPMVLLHGGPGIPSNYIEGFAATMYEKFGTPTVIYDQFGCGRSTHVPERMGDIEFWTRNGISTIFQEELKALLDHLGISSDYDLWGHSWGGVLAFEFCLQHPEGLKHLILASAPSDIPLWVSAQAKLLQKLPKDVQEKIKKHEADGTTDSPEYQEAVMYFMSKHVCRMEEWPESLMDSMKEMGKDTTVYATLNGPSEFTVVGPLKDWSGISRIPGVKAPTLITNGKYDEATDENVKPYFDGIKDAEWITFDNSAHMAHIEEEDKYAAAIYHFLTK